MYMVVLTGESMVTVSRMHALTRCAVDACVRDGRPRR
jgi:hypothetical protein